MIGLVPNLPNGKCDGNSIGPLSLSLLDGTNWAYPDPLPWVFNEGYLSVAVAPYLVPYRCIVPKYDDCRSLLVPVCASASHVAFASLRMEPQYELLGQAAGIAAAQAVATNRAVQRIDVRRLQDQLVAAGAVLAL